MRELHVLRRDRVRPATQRKALTRTVRAGNLRGESAEEHRRERERCRGERASRGARARRVTRVATEPPRPPARSTVAASAARSSAPLSKCATVAHAVLPMRTVTIPSSAWNTTSPAARSAARSTPPRPDTPGSARFEREQHERHDHRDGDRGEQAVRPLDHQRRLIHRREPAAVAARPVVAAPHARSGNAHDRAEDDERVRHPSVEYASLRNAFKYGSLRHDHGWSARGCSARQVNTSTSASISAGSTVHATSMGVDGAALPSGRCARARSADRTMAACDSAQHTAASQKYDVRQESWNNQRKLSGQADERQPAAYGVPHACRGCIMGNGSVRPPRPAALAASAPPRPLQRRRGAHRLDDRLRNFPVARRHRRQAPRATAAALGVALRRHLRALRRAHAGRGGERVSADGWTLRVHPRGVGSPRGVSLRLVRAHPHSRRLARRHLDDLRRISLSRAGS